MSLRDDVDYTDPSQQDVAFAGPIPEATYSLPLTEGMRFDKPGAEDGAGWGEGGWLLKESFLNRFGGRDGFFIHEDGGNPGTAGCVGLDHEGLLQLRGIMHQLQNDGRSSVRVRVNYDN